MSTKRRVGVSSATTEAARRQLMQPVQSWEKVWVVPDVAPAGTLRVLKWTKTSKTQHFSDDEGEADEPLAPLPDEVEVVEGDEEDQDEVAVVAPVPDTTEAPAPEEEPPSKPPSPKPQLSMGLQPPEDLDDPESNSALDESLKTMEANMDQGVGVGLDTDEGLMDISTLAPDGLGLEGSHDLTQLDEADALLGGPLQMDESDDPFAPPIEP
ncbi:hypothetical protein DFH08DRAFT_768026 [Mycena albidolilacea]|uniref:Uncharacterized protein n=1 Tax=Mycena albidolilacea TaxID=1033008 RepID=A0AAD7AKA2_9AGAR|nr:hypothetical protein DFH08DRAFT_768026 [Mycena albidolilacea]